MNMNEKGRSQEEEALDRALEEKFGCAVYHGYMMPWPPKEGPSSIGHEGDGPVEPPIIELVKPPALPLTAKDPDPA
jgi:hypothetical protein